VFEPWITPVFYLSQLCSSCEFQRPAYQPQPLLDLSSLFSSSYTGAYLNPSDAFGAKFVGYTGEPRNRYTDVDEMLAAAKNYYHSTGLSGPEVTVDGMMSTEHWGTHFKVGDDASKQEVIDELKKRGITHIKQTGKPVESLFK